MNTFYGPPLPVLSRGSVSKPRFSSGNNGKVLNNQVKQSLLALKTKVASRQHASHYGYATQKGVQNPEYRIGYSRFSNARDGYGFSVEFSQEFEFYAKHGVSPFVMDALSEKTGVSKDMLKFILGSVRDNKSPEEIANAQITSSQSHGAPQPNSTQKYTSAFNFSLNPDTGEIFERMQGSLRPKGISLQDLAKLINQCDWDVEK